MDKESKAVSNDKESSSNSPNNDEFELTAEMMVNDFDDERTLDEEEALAEVDEDQDNELSNLEKEKDIPISALLAMYGYNDNNREDPKSSSSDEESVQGTESGREESREPIKEQERELTVSVEDEEMLHGKEMVLRVIGDDGPEEKRSRSLLHELYSEEDAGGPHAAARHLRSGSGQQSEDEEEEDDGDYSPDEDDWKKTIMVGSDFQASIPEGLQTYDDAMPYENEDKLLWDPLDMAEKDVKDYLSAVQDLQVVDAIGIDSIPKGAHVRDDEQALFLLLQCGNNTEEALRRIKLNNLSTGDTMTLWSEEECRNFENGLRQYGKDFHQIQQNKVRTRSVNELVQFYYLWKKTERHDVFANKSKLEKKKYSLHPGTTDFMERFLDEQDSPVPSPSIHSLLSGDPKRQGRTTLGGYGDSMDQISCDDARIISSHFEDLARHLDQDSLQFLRQFATVSAPNKSTSSQNGESPQIEATPIMHSRAPAFHSSSEPYLSHSPSPQQFSQ